MILQRDLGQPDIQFDIFLLVYLEFWKGYDLLLLLPLLYGKPIKCHQTRYIL